VIFFFLCYLVRDLGNQKKNMDLITIFDAILTGRQSGQKLQCLCGEQVANNFLRNRILHNL